MKGKKTFSKIKQLSLQNYSLPIGISVINSPWMLFVAFLFRGTVEHNTTLHISCVSPTTILCKKTNKEQTKCSKSKKKYTTMGKRHENTINFKRKMKWYDWKSCTTTSHSQVETASQRKQKSGAKTEKL